MHGQQRTQWDGWLSVDEVAVYLNVSSKTVYRYAAALGARKLGNSLRFKAAEVDRRLEVLDPDESLSVPKTLFRNRKTDTDTALDSPDSHPEDQEAPRGMD